MTSRLEGSVLCDGVRRLRAVARVLAVVTLGGWFGAPSAAASVGGAPVTGPAQIGPAQIGPAQINVLGHPRLCWQAGGNGSPITLERCDPAIQGQQWSLTGNGVMMNGNGYCLEAGAGGPLYIDFAGQCGGSHGQVWQYRGGTGQLSSIGICAGVGGPISPRAEIVRRACPAGAGRGPRWSIGYSAATVAAGPGSGPAGGQFGASVTVANAASAQTAYGVAVMFALPPDLAAAGLYVVGGGPGWSCDIRTLTCTGTLMSGASGRVGITGRLPARAGDSYIVVAQASVAGTSQRPGPTRTTASVTVDVHPAAPGTAGAAGQQSRFPSVAGLPLMAVIAGVLLLGGGLLIVIARRSRATPARR